MVDDLLHIYVDEVPDFLYEIADTPHLQRIKGVGMNCGCEYTSFPFFTALLPYSRYTHSLGVGAIVWNFTKDPKQAIAGLLHDVASPVFAHVIDFMKGDYLVQEATEGKTHAIISSSDAICECLSKMGLSVAEVSDYHIYPIADNKTPQLSADRLEYSFGNILNFRLGTMADVKRMYSNLIVADNEYGTSELSFTNSTIARDFALKALECGKVYVCDADRYAMQFLSQIIDSALKRGLLTESLLYTTENEVIEVLTSDEQGKRDWEQFRSLSQAERLSPEIDLGSSAAAYNLSGSTPAQALKDFASVRHLKDSISAYPIYNIAAKKRYIDPFVAEKGRVSELFPEFKEAVDSFIAMSFNYNILGGRI